MGKQVTDLTALTSPDSADIIYIVDMSAGPAGKKITVANLLAAVSGGSHTHSAADITSGTLAHERGGLETDISAITTGGILRGTGAGTLGILAAGSDGQVLTVQGDGSVAWEDAVGGAVDSLDLKSSVKAATTANITLSGEQTIDGVSCVAGDRVLVKDQSTATENGIYVVSAYAWSRASDMAAASDAAATFGHIQQGTLHGDQKWLCTNNTGSATVGTHNLVFTLETTGTGGTYLAGDGSAASPSYSFAADSDTGLFRSADNTISISFTGASCCVMTGAGGGAGSSFRWGNAEYAYIAESSAGTLMAADTLAFGNEYDNGNSGSGTVDIDWQMGNGQKLTLTGNCTLAFGLAGHSPDLTGFHCSLKLIQDGTGSRTVTWPASVKWAGGTPPTLSTGASQVDIIDFYCDSVNYYGFVRGKNFS